MKILQRIGILFFLMVFLAGTIGISIFEHVCTCKGETEITLFPEIFDHESSCCCSDGEVQHVSPEVAGFCGFENSDHCKNIKVFIKAGIAPVPVAMNLISFDHFSATDFPLPVNVSPVAGIPADERIFHDCASPPISGRERIIAFHSSKLPAPDLLLV